MKANAILAVVVVMLLVITIGCVEEKPASQLVVGDRLQKLYTRDLKTGRCVSIDNGKFNDILVEPESICEGK